MNDLRVQALLDADADDEEEGEENDGLYNASPSIITPVVEKRSERTNRSSNGTLSHFLAIND